MAADLERFVLAQDRVWTDVTDELRRGEKRTHWMWFVFPQLGSLGRSETARFYGLQGAEDAARYLAHPVLGQRLEGVTQLVIANKDRSAIDIFGPVDAIKFRSSMTLFSHVAAASQPFEKALELFFDSERCPLTEAALSR